MASAKKSDINRLRMEMALEQLLEIEGQPKELQKKYKALVRKFPLMLRHNGLGASFGYLYSKAKTKVGAEEEEGKPDEEQDQEESQIQTQEQDQEETQEKDEELSPKPTEHAFLMQHLITWTQNVSTPWVPELAGLDKPKENNPEELLMLMLATQEGEGDYSISNTNYRLLQRELLAYTTWLKRIAEAKIKSD